MDNFALTHPWRDTFMQTVQKYDLVVQLKAASRQGKRVLTATGTTFGWS